MVSEKGLAQPDCAILTGVTASGKTALALKFCALHPELEIINADSLLFYRGMDIGTAKPTEHERSQTKHHLIDIRNPDEAYTAGDFAKDVEKARAEITAAGKRALIVGGSGFYLKALIYGLWDAPPTDLDLRTRLEKETSATLYARLLAVDQPAALRIGQNDRYRLVRSLEIFELTSETPTELQSRQNRTPNSRFKLLVLDRGTDELFSRIEERTKNMLVLGLVEEVSAIRKSYPTSRALDAVGYAQVIAFLDGTPPPGRKLNAGLSGLTSEIELATRQLVKRQRTWFRSEKSAHYFLMDQDSKPLWQNLSEIYGVKP